MKPAILAAAAAALVALPAFAQTSPIGVWWMPEQSAKLKIAACPTKPDRLCGAIVWIKPRDPSKPIKTRDGKPAPDGQSFVGTMILKDLKPNGPGKWSGGRFEFPGMTQKIAASITQQPGGVYKMSGCAALVLCGGMELKRAD